MKESRRFSRSNFFSNTITPEETHQIGHGDHSTLLWSSEAEEWPASYLSRQSEVPYEGTFEGAPHALIGLTLSGSVDVTMRMRGRPNEKRMVPGAFSIVPAKASFDVGLEDPSETLHLYLHQSRLVELGQELTQSDAADIALLPRFGAVDPFVEQATRALLEASAHQSPASALYVDHVVKALALHLLTFHSTIGKPSRKPRLPSGLDIQTVQRIRDFVTAHIAAPLTLDELCRHTNLSVGHFSRAFKKSTGQSPYQFVLRARVECAQKMLHDRTLSIAKIAVACGFADQTHLTKAFRRIVGVSPARYRETKIF